MVVDNAAGEDPDFSEFVMNAVVIHPEYAKSNGDTIRKFNRALHKASNWLLDQPAQAGVASMKPFLGRLDDKVILEGLQKTRLGIPARPASASGR
jgi:ABC-type nitrate/sulfonate/bicarbonate transport system substrate-binding protein